MARWLSIGPVSTPGSIFMMVMPVCLISRQDGRLDGAAPRPRGSSEPWMLIQPNFGRSSTSGRRICPNAATTIRSGAHARNWVHGFGIAQLFRLDDGNTETERGCFDSRRLQGPAAPGRAIGLGHHADQCVMGGQRLQSRDGKVRRAHKYNANSWKACCYSSIFPHLFPE